LSGTRLGRISWPPGISSTGSVSSTGKRSRVRRIRGSRRAARSGAMASAILIDQTLRDYRAFLPQIQGPAHHVRRGRRPPRHDGCSSAMVGRGRGHGLRAVAVLGIPSFGPAQPKQGKARAGQDKRRHAGRDCLPGGGEPAGIQEGVVGNTGKLSQCGGGRTDHDDPVRPGRGHQRKQREDRRVIPRALPRSRDQPREHQCERGGAALGGRRPRRRPGRLLRPRGIRRVGRADETGAAAAERAGMPPFGRPSGPSQSGSPTRSSRSRPTWRAADAGRSRRSRKPRRARGTSRPAHHPQPPPNRSPGCRRVLADKGYLSRANRAWLRERGIAATIPERDDQIAHRRKKRGRPTGYLAASCAFPPCSGRVLC